MEEIETRVERLERSNRKLRMTVTFLALALATLTAVGMQRERTKLGDVDARSLRIVDESGATVVSLRGSAGEGIVIVSNESPERAFVVKTSARTCMANMQTMANALRANQVVRRLSLDELVAGGLNTENMPDLMVLPICPKDGKYSLSRGKVSFVIRCSIGAHGSFEPGAAK